MFRDVLVMGGGSAGLMAALALKTRIPETNVTVVRSQEMGVIGVGESTTPNMPYFLFDYLGLSRRRFFELANPTWKLSVHFLWGPRGVFDYTFDSQIDMHPTNLKRALGYYCDDDFTSMNMQSALAEAGKAFMRRPDGQPGIRPRDPFHLENPKFVKAMETFCAERGVQLLDARIKQVERGGEGIAALHLEDGRRLAADFFIDASGFRSELLGKTLEEPFNSYGNMLFDDRAVVGSWDRVDEPIMPYTTAETMDAGWCWKIEHEQKINRGYVFSSRFISEEQAREEFQRKNPKAKIWDGLIKFQSGRYQRAWVGNVMAVGNACGFVEPLESSALMVVGHQVELFTEMVRNSGITPTMRDAFNAEWGGLWDEIRDFLTLHFWPNTKLQTPYWQHCNNETDLSHVKPLLDFYQENGPCIFGQQFLKSRGNLFGLAGFLVQLVGNKVPYRNRYVPAQEREIICNTRCRQRATAAQGVTVKEALSYVRHPGWQWAGEN